ncbi:MAG: hypothetical protein EOO60_13030 [Hymenobacter sp.]|nr:MAG: hypothetical protein EOO60_13030 [Hymenobacter sp.]
MAALRLFWLARWSTGKRNQQLVALTCYSTVLLLALTVVVGMLGLEWAAFRSLFRLVASFITLQETVLFWRVTLDVQCPGQMSATG